MVDYTKCKGKDCPLKENCYRYIAKDSYMQSYFAKENLFEILNDKVICKYFIRNETKKTKERKI